MPSPAAPVRLAVMSALLACAACAATGGGPVAAPPAASGPAQSASAPEAAASPADQGGPYDALIARYASENGVPLPLAHAVIQKESGYNAAARGRGTLGLMQIKPATARGIGYRGSAQGLYDPETNLRWGMKYLGVAHQLGGGDVCGTALRYQGGHRATRQTAATRRYCSALKSIMAGGAGS